jgi:G:T-mismatch repair DNA endonuclease (very short patch repair protein)
MPKKLSQEEVIKQFEETHGVGKFDYSKVIYLSAKTKVIITCNTCKYEFLQTPIDHKTGYGCPECAGVKRLTTEEVIKQFEETQGVGKFDYSKVNYINNGTKVSIICNTCKKNFLRLPSNHKKGVGCPKCWRDKKPKNRLLSQEHVIKQFEETHGVGTYDYSRVKYVNTHSKVLIKCNTCNKQFLQTPDIHKTGSGCPKCFGKAKLTLKEAIKQFESTHGKGTFDYSKVVYRGVFTKVRIICNTCKYKFLQTPSDHKKGSGCPNCVRTTSTLENDWLNSLGLPDDLQHRQVSLPNLRVSVDGYDPKTKTVYEFHGDYWHGNPKVYAPTFLNKKNKETMGKLYEKTIKRENRIKDAGYNLVVIWESEWYKQRETQE